MLSSLFSIAIRTIDINGDGFVARSYLYDLTQRQRVRCCVIKAKLAVRRGRKATDL